MNSPFAVSVLVVGVGILYAVINFYGFYTDDLPKLQAQRQQAEGELASREAELKRLQNFAQNIETVKQELRELNLQLESALESMPRTFNLSGLLRKLNLLAQNSGVELSTFKPKAPDPTIAAAPQPGQPAPAPGVPGAPAGDNKNFYSTIGIEFTMSGSFTQTLVFFDQVTRLKRIININSLKMTTREESGNTGNGQPRGSVAMVTTEATIETYRFSE